jgi:hypothetical protein
MVEARVAAAAAAAAAATDIAERQPFCYASATAYSTICK